MTQPTNSSKNELFNVEQKNILQRRSSDFSKRFQRSFSNADEINKVQECAYPRVSEVTSPRFSNKDSGNTIFSLDLSKVKKSQHQSEDTTPRSSVRIIGASAENSPRSSEEVCLSSRISSKIAEDLLNGSSKHAPESNIFLSWLSSTDSPIEIAKALCQAKDSSTPKRRETRICALLYQTLQASETVCIANAFFKEMGNSWESYKKEAIKFSEFVLSDKKINRELLLGFLLDFVFSIEEPRTVFRENSWYVYLIKSLINESLSSEYKSTLKKGWKAYKGAKEVENVEAVLYHLYATPLPLRAVNYLDIIRCKALRRGWTEEESLHACSGILFQRILGFEISNSIRSHYPGKILNKLIEWKGPSEDGASEEESGYNLEGLNLLHQKFIKTQCNIIQYCFSNCFGF